MSIFGTIMSKIFHHAEAAPAQTQTASADASPAPGGASAPSDAPASGAPTAAPSPATTASQGTASPGTPASTAAAPTSVDVAAVLEGLAAKNSQTLDWKHSIVDMMKLLDLDSSLTARKALAQELHYSGDMNDSASMNIWLHKQVMQKLAENGGKVPADLQG